MQNPKEPDLLTRLIYPDDAPIVCRHLETCLSNQRDVIECRIVTKNGEIRWVRNYLEPVWVAKALAKLLNVQDIYTIGLVRGRQMLGNLHIIARRPDLIEQPKLIESFAHQVALALVQAKAN